MNTIRERTLRGLFAVRAYDFIMPELEFQRSLICTSTLLQPESAIFGGFYKFFFLKFTLRIMLRFSVKCLLPNNIVLHG